MNMVGFKKYKKMLKKKKKKGNLNTKKYNT